MVMRLGAGSLEFGALKEFLAPAAGVTRHYRLGVLGEPTRCTG